jgi:hypothetical protein
MALTIFLGGGFMAKNPFLYPTSSYDPVVDLAPVTKVSEFTNVWWCRIPHL